MQQFDRHNHEAFPVLILAAGASRRMGRHKALLSFDGETLLDRAIAQGKRLGSNVTVVTGSGYPLIRYRCRRMASSWCHAENWYEGMSASLQAGLMSLGPRALGAFVLLLDQPLIESDDLHHLAIAARQTPSVPLAADIHGKPAAPAYLPRALWPEVMMLSGDRGASSVLARHEAIRLPIVGAFDDVDTHADWLRVSRQFRERFAVAGGSGN
ncbi:nucleotidyltransferase family protein [Marinobacter sp. CHS3-4]|uniref:nucleotidyltransferase family protein n=1 Tax=Marinobacter sp. CHS3-4 TaxID=3045174 RepID=UPI0024B59B23|nr:nucleotidyltransferase family protein [Marinobacter sp. CHS3-4]MDI9245827.1 nucleotidyltransferase family protein [Marinobacter sp. CHS3-4]